MTSDIRPVSILLVEDNLQDVEITRRAFAKGRVRNDLTVVRDGEEALDYLFRRGKYRDPASSPRPGMILLDLNLPKLGGLEVLQQIKNDESLKTIPVIVLTVSQREQDIVRSYNLGVNTYIQKPVEFENFMHVVNTVHDYWILIATLPPSST
ncbi:MAG TPA: response regulator [Nitrospiria bacterium]|nr:response regulator [Nitrospiria bacterium]